MAERIATLGHSPQGTPAAIIKDRTWDDYSVGRDTVQAHLAALDLVYDGVIEDVRKGIATTEELDPVTQDLLIGQAAELEKFQWFVRAHLENAGGALSHEGASTEKQAARKRAERRRAQRSRAASRTGRSASSSPGRTTPDTARRRWPHRPGASQNAHSCAGRPRR